jgi:hypothetical protein
LSIWRSRDVNKLYLSANETVEVTGALMHGDEFE